MTVEQLKVFRKDLYYERTGYCPHGGQRVVHASAARHRVLCCGRRWGKTLAGGKEAEVMAYLRNRMGDPMKGWIVGPEFRDCEKEFRVVYDSFKKLGVDVMCPKFVKNVDNGNMHITTSWGFDLECRSAKHPETLTGEGLDFVLMVEAGRHKRKTWAESIRPSLSDKRGWSLISGVPEGASETSLLYSLWQRGQDQRKKLWASIRMPSWTNDVVFPGGRTDPEILDAEDDLTEEEFRRQYGAEFVEQTGRVMKEWDDEVHIRDLKYRRDWPLYLAVDYGYTNDWVLLFIQVDSFNNVYVIREKRWKLTDTEVVAKEAIDDPVLGPLIRAAIRLYPDPANPDDTNILRRHWQIQSGGDTGGEINDRMKLIRKALKRLTPEGDHVKESNKWPGLAVERSCTMLIWEMREGYRWPEHKSETRNESEVPMDKDNHGPEALSRFFKGYMGIVEIKRAARQRKAKVGR